MFATCRGQLILQLVFVSSLVLVNSAGAFRQGETTVKGHHHDKRVNKTINGFDNEQKAAILDRHNHLRAQTHASNMLTLTWSPQLESLAQNYTAQCKFQHNSHRQNVAGFRYVGENLYAGTGDFAPEAVIQHWYDEVKDYNYRSGRCRPQRACGHYTQIVWADTRSVGCGVKYCEHFNQANSIGFSQGYLIVCNYGPGGNWVGQKPYEAGTPCSHCPAGTTCAQGLCGKCGHIL
ncbi:hypothetical protein BsWGS_22756 [Bradybaena similaris]